MKDKFKTAREARPIADAIPVIWILVTQKCGGRRIKISAIQHDHHLVDEVHWIQQYWKRRIPRTIGIVPEKRLVDSVILCFAIAGRKAGICLLPKAEPGIQIPVCSMDGVSRRRIYFDRIVIVGIPSKICGTEVCLRALVDVVDSPLLAVDIEMVEKAVAARLA